MTPARVFFLVAAIAFLVSCGGGPTEPSDYEFGRADIYVRDDAQQPIDGVAVRLVRPNGQTEDPGGATGSVGVRGYYFFLETSGEFDVIITVPAGYTLAPQQTAARRIQFQRGQLQTVNFVLQRT
jgi:hypothetical protein